MTTVSWKSVEALPSGLDESEALVFRENAEAGTARVLIGGLWYVWADRDEVWRQIPVAEKDKEDEDKKDGDGEADGAGDPEVKKPSFRWQRSHFKPDSFTSSMWVEVREPSPQASTAS